MAIRRRAEALRLRRVPQGLEDAGVPIVGTSPAAIHLAEERGAFGRVLHEAGLPAPKFRMATSFADAKAIAARASPKCANGRTGFF